jgi:tripartite-type tricarboxylate transporter receptor subunit TctC
MALPRRRFLHVAAGVLALPFVSRGVWAETYPSRPVRFIVPFAAGGVSDILGRLIGQSLSERMGQPFVVEDRSGAGSNVGTELVVNSTPDGHTLLLDGSSNTVNASLYKDLSFDFLRDVAPVAGVFRAPHIMEVSPSFPAKTIPDFIAYAKAHPGQINMASAGIGTISHMAGELFKLMAGVEMTHVPYRGASPALTDLLSGQVQVMFDNAASSIDHIRAGRLHALGVTTGGRAAQLPEIPAIAEFVPGYEASNVNGVGVPAKTPPEIVALLNGAINASLKGPSIEGRITELGGAVMTGSEVDYGSFLATDTEKWAKVVKAAGLQPA